MKMDQLLKNCLMLCLGLVFFLAFTAELSAQGAPDVDVTDLKDLDLEDLMSIEVATVSTATKRLEKATSTPGTIYVVDKQDIRLRGYRNLKDVLRDLPGMETTEYFFSEVGTQVAVRGITGNNKVVVLVNGMRVNPPGGEFFPFRSDFGVRNVEQIEVIYGPGSTLYGQDAISAVINVKTKGPGSGGKENGWNVVTGAEGGFFEEQGAWLTFDKKFQQEDLSLTGYLQYHDSDLSDIHEDFPEWWQGYSTTAQPKGSGDPPDRKDYGLNAFTRLEAGNFSLQSWFRESERSSSEGFNPILGYTPEALWGDRSWVTEAKYKYELSDRLRCETAATYSWYEIFPESRYVFPASSTAWFLDDYKYGNQHAVTIEDTLYYEISEKVSILGGVNYTAYDVVPKSTIPGGATRGSDMDLIEQGGSFTYYTVAGDSSSIQTIPRVVEIDWERYGGYFELNWQLNPKVELLAGVRVDKDSRIDDLSVTPRVALIGEINDKLTAKYTYATAYISPSPYFGFATFDNGSLLNTSNPALEPEESEVHEINLTWHSDWLYLSSSIYYGQQEKLILLGERRLPPNIIANTVYLDLAGTQTRQLGQTVNSGSSENIGFDLFAKAKIQDKFNVWASYSYVDFEETTAGLVSGMPGISHHNYRAGATWAVTPELFVTPSLSARSTPVNIQSSMLDSALEDPWQANLHVLYTPRDNLEFYFSLLNVTDHNYALGGVLGQAVPQETLSGVAGIRVKF